MKTYKIGLEKAASILGTAMMLSWMVVVGLGGFLLLIGAFYALSSNSISLVVVCCFGLFIPLVFTLLWGFYMIEEAAREWIAKRIANGKAGSAIATHQMAG